MNFSLQTQYIRIKLKPDDLYDDKGLSSNERVIEENEVSKPDSLSLSKSATKKAAPHFTQLVQSEGISKQTDQHLTPTASPKPSRNPLKNAGSRSPSPATTGISISRKSSFCSLFKSKEVASPLAHLDSPRDRSRSKSRESEKSAGGISANSTPSKQRSVLAIFKPRRNSSKSTSPIDPEMNEIMSVKQEHHSRKQTHKQEEFQQRPGSTTPRLKYYEDPKDPNEGIRIPLRTPPDEKENLTFASTIVSSTQSNTKPIPSTHITTSADIIIGSAPKLKTPVSEQRLKQPITKSIVSTSTTPTATAQPTIKKNYRIELPDGSIRIPLRSPSDERTELIDDIDIENNSQLWSTAVQRNSSQESQDTVISSKAASLISSSDIQMNKTSMISAVAVAAVAQSPPITTVKPDETPPKQTSQEETTVVSIESANGGVRALSKERKRILFSTRIGSGSEEQIFATQLSLSKTESLCSQLSEQVPNLESPSAEKSEATARSDEPKPQSTPPQIETVVVQMRIREDKNHETDVVKQEIINVNRHSMYIENIDEIMETQRRIDSMRKSSIAKIEQTSAENVIEPPKQVVKPIKPERISKTQSSPKSRDSTETDHRTPAGGSSGSEHDSEIDSKV